MASAQLPVALVWCASFFRRDAWKVLCLGLTQKLDRLELLEPPEQSHSVCVALGSCAWEADRLKTAPEVRLQEWFQTLTAHLAWSCQTDDSTDTGKLAPGAQLARGRVPLSHAGGYTRLLVGSWADFRGEIAACKGLLSVQAVVATGDGSLSTSPQHPARKPGSYTVASQSDTVHPIGYSLLERIAVHAKSPWDLFFIIGAMWAVGPAAVLLGWAVGSSPLMRVLERAICGSGGVRQAEGGKGRRKSLGGSRSEPMSPAVSPRGGRRRGDDLMSPSVSPRGGKARAKGVASREEDLVAEVRIEAALLPPFCPCVPCVRILARCDCSLVSPATALSKQIHGCMIVAPPACPPRQHTSSR